MGSSALELGKLRPREAQGPAAIRAGIRIRCSRLPGWRSFCPSCLLPDAAGNGATVTRSSTPQAASWFWVFPEDQARAAKMMRTDVHLCLGNSLSVRSYQSLRDFSCVTTRIPARASLPSCLQLKCLLLFVCFRLCWVFTAVRAFSTCGEQGLLSSCGARGLVAVASPATGHRL